VSELGPCPASISNWSETSKRLATACASVERFARDVAGGCWESRATVL
jgi:hypothetical protein